MKIIRVETSRSAGRVYFHFRASWLSWAHQGQCKARTNQLVGAPTQTGEHTAIRFTVTPLPLPDGGITVALDHAGDLADIYDLCTRIDRACLNDDHGVAFSRATSEPTEAAS
jgi:hypothetical protein